MKESFEDNKKETSDLLKVFVLLLSLISFFKLKALFFWHFPDISLNKNYEQPWLELTMETMDGWITMETLCLRVLWAGQTVGRHRVEFGFLMNQGHRVHKRIVKFTNYNKQFWLVRYDD